MSTRFTLTWPKGEPLPRYGEPFTVYVFKDRPIPAILEDIVHQPDGSIHVRCVTDDHDRKDDE